MMNCPIEERPREKAIRYGVETLSHQELIAVILRTGNKDLSVLELAQYLLEEIGGFHQLKDVDYYQLIQIKGIKKAKAIELLSCIELAKRMQNIKDYKYVIKEPADGYNLVKNKLLFEKQEKVILLCLNAKLEVVLEKLLFIGGETSSFLEPMKVFQQTLKCGASRFMLIHNHPSGNPSPSYEDEMMTKKLLDMAKHLQIEMVDHLIIGAHCFYSFASGKVHQCKDN